MNYVIVEARSVTLTHPHIKLNKETPRFMWFGEKKFSYVHGRQPITITKVFTNICFTLSHYKVSLTKFIPIASRHKMTLTLCLLTMLDKPLYKYSNTNAHTWIKMIHVPIWEMDQINLVDSWIKMGNVPKVFTNSKDPWTKSSWQFFHSCQIDSFFSIGSSKYLIHPKFLILTNSKNVYMKIVN